MPFARNLSQFLCCLALFFSPLVYMLCEVVLCIHVDCEPASLNFIVLCVDRAPVLEKASKSVWDLILDSNALGKEISETVERVFCRLSGQEPPLFPTAPDGGSQPGKGIANERAKELNDDCNEKERSSSASKKRSFNEMSTGEDNDLTRKSDDSSALPEESSKSPQKSFKT